MLFINMVHLCPVHTSPEKMDLFLAMSPFVWEPKQDKKMEESVLFLSSSFNFLCSY